MMDNRLGRQPMTKQEAIDMLEITEELSTAMLEPLGISFEAWLAYVQATPQTREALIEKLIAFYKEQ